MNCFFFDLCMLYIQECKQQLRTMKKNTRRYKILHTLNLDCSFITLRESYNDQQLRCYIAWLHATNHLHHGFPELNDNTIKRNRKQTLNSEEKYNIHFLPKN